MGGQSLPVRKLISPTLRNGGINKITTRTMKLQIHKCIKSLRGQTMDRQRSEHFGDTCTGPLYNMYILLYVFIYLLKHTLGTYNYQSRLDHTQRYLRTGAYQTSLVAMPRFIRPLQRHLSSYHVSWTSILRYQSKATSSAQNP